MQVDVYYNIRRRDFSIRYKGKVIEHDDSVFLRNARFIVSEAGRQRVLTSGHKNVHAFVRGEISEGLRIIFNSSEAYYNPFKTEKFIDIKTREPLDSADAVILFRGRVFYGE